MTDAIQVQNVYKQYNKFGTMRVRTIAQDLTRALRKTSTMMQTDANSVTQYVLNDINFNLEQGKSLGLIGHNGSGKTTLLRLLAGVSLPTKGRVRVVGKVAPLLALGAGFHPDLTGHENLFLNCTLMGLSRKQSLDRIDQIIDFADIGEYIEVPIKRYSSGMLARLGFAAAIHMDPEIILLDEVLSVGDYVFGIKASAAIREFVGRGTLVFVSHSLDSVEKLCERTIWMDAGRIRADGNSSDVIASYTQDQQNQINTPRKEQKPPAQSDSDTVQVSESDIESGVQTRSINAHDDDDDTVRVHKRVIDSRVQICGVSVHDKDGAAKTQFQFGEEIVLRCRIQLSQPIADMRVAMGIIDINSRTVVTLCDNQQLGPLGESAGELLMEAHFPGNHFRPLGLGVYVAVSNPIALLELTSWQDIGPRFFTIGSRRDPEHYYYAPQRDLIFTHGVHMKRIDNNS